MLKYKPAKLNTAQQLLVSVGVDDLRLLAHHGGKKRPSATKSGPGRRHEPGHERFGAAAATKQGAGPGFAQHTNPAKNTRRAEFSRLGRRQALKIKKALTRQIKERLAAGAA